MKLLLLLLLLVPLMMAQQLSGKINGQELEQRSGCHPSWSATTRRLEKLASRSERLLHCSISQRDTVTLYHAAISVISELLRSMPGRKVGHPALSARLLSAERIIRLQQAQIERLSHQLHPKLVRLLFNEPD
jgi:hypothetical protein